MPPFIAFKGFPTRNLIKVTLDGLEFSRRAPVAFSDLTSWGTDDLLKLVRQGHPTLLESARDLPNLERLLLEFQNGLEEWQKRQLPGTKPARRTHFYGSHHGNRRIRRCNLTHVLTVVTVRTRPKRALTSSIVP
ncbi:hypothetical protein OIV19_23255 [Brucella sp. HL-2]|nr:hypothetical protein [Brucella sp. HL-2]MCV9910477.1 hypothetical protein [Brucella sp. HL-2]